ncbi:MAG: aminotransferase class I/II-fold pyridoxal phosphate-dependent enzyme [Myxococcota bacterium]|nr:aminotransferase class I/II-fold pyridoxal phosphate-dependent enzyme [Myxococcota bacterium]
MPSRTPDYEASQGKLQATVYHEDESTTLLFSSDGSTPTSYALVQWKDHLDPITLLLEELEPQLAEATGTFVRDLERALRNPPTDLDELDLEALNARPSEKWATYPDPEVICCWVAEMDYPLAHPIRNFIQRAVDTNDLGYVLELRDTGIMQAFAERMDECFGWEVAPERCEVLSEVVQGLYISLEAYSEPGDAAVVQTSIYPPFLSAVRDTGRRLINNKLVYGESGFEVDFDALRRDIDSGTRTLLLCNPHNPTGRVFTRSELEQFGEIALQNDLVVVTDEIHSDLVFDGREHIPFGTLSPEIGERTVTLTSASKAFNIPGLRTAIAHFGSEDLHKRFNGAVTRHIRGGIGLLGVYTSIAAWKHSQPWVEQVRDYLQDNRNFATEFLRKRCPDLKFSPPEATYLMWFDCEAYALKPSPARFFYEHGKIAMSDGRMFGPGYEDFVRLNIATSRPILSEILERFATALESR